MCETCNLSKVQVDLGEKKFRLVDYFRANWGMYVKDNRETITLEQHKAASAIQVCRTAAIGIDQYVCKDCGEVKEIYHNCNNRFCPTCGWRDTLKWADKLETQLMAVPHRHAVFTIPHQLIPLVKYNGKTLLNVLFRTASDTYKDWAEHKYNLKTGVISVLHTYGEKKESHIHVHMIVSWGGINNDTNKLEVIKGEYVNFKFLQGKFRIKFEDELVSLYRSKELKHDFPDDQSFFSFIHQINEKHWQIHIEPPMISPLSVIRYIGRYSKRVCLSERKITEIDGEYISFRHKNYKIIGPDKRPIEQELRLHYTEFFPRLMQHVPKARFRLVRYYGVYSTKGHIPAEYLNQERSSATLDDGFEWENPFICSTCQTKREYLHTIFDRRPYNKRLERFDIRIHPYIIHRRN